MKSFFAVILMLAAFAQKATLGVAPPQRIVETAVLSDDQYIEQVLYKATGLLYNQADDGAMHMRCTVTAIEKTPKGYIFVTAAHCVGSDDTEKERVKPDKTYFFITSDSDGGSKDFMKAKLLAAGYQHESDDFALLEVETDQQFPLIAIGDDVTDHSGQPVVNVASPLGLGKQTFKGIVSSPKLARPVVEGDINWTEAMAIQLFGANGGSSGSAIICLKQRAICGFLVGTIGGTKIAIQVSRFKTFRRLVAEGKYEYFKPKKATGN
jgi:hypothetical protein